MDSKLCTPALVYAILAAGSVLISLVQRQYVGAISFAVFAALWTMFLNYLCSKGYGGWSWFLVLLPIILYMVLLVAAGAFVLGKSL